MKKSLAPGLFLAFLLAACGGGGGGGGGTGAPAPAPAPAQTPVASEPDTTPPSIASFLPNTAGRVPRTTEISATFSEPMMPATVTDANLRLAASAAPVPAALNYDAASRKVSFVPQQTLDLLASYTVSAGTGLEDLAGNSLATEQSWTFKTGDGSWQLARRLDAATATSLHPDVAIDSAANAVAVWASDASSGWYEIRTAGHGESSGWGAVRTLSTPGNYNAFFPKVRFDEGGNGLAVWTQSGGTAAGTGASVWSARYVKGQGWQPAVAVDAHLANVQEISLAVDAAGNAFAAWAKPVGPGLLGNSDIWAARFTPGGGWQSATRLGSAANIGTYDQADQPQVAVDGAGNAYVLWIQTASSAPVWFARHEAGSGWQAAVSVGAVEFGTPFAPRLAVSAAGQAMALWNTSIYIGGPYRFDIWSSFLASPTGTWSTPALLENDDAGDALWQTLVADSAGHFHAVWAQFASTYGSDIRHRGYTPGTGWGAPLVISAASGTYDRNMLPSVVADRNGNLMAMWSVYASGFGGAQEGTFARRYIGGEGWQAMARIDAAQGGWGLAHSLAVSPNGSIGAIWMQPNPFRSDGPVWVNMLK